MEEKYNFRLISRSPGIAGDSKIRIPGANHLFLLNNQEGTGDSGIF